MAVSRKPPAICPQASLHTPPTTVLSRAIRGALAMSAIAGIGLASPTFAANYVVTNTLDDGSTGSLRYAIFQANVNAGADTITFASGVTGTITLSPSYGSLYIYDPLTITGPGASALTIDGGNIPAPSTTSSVPASGFLVAGGTASALPVSIGGLTITGGHGTPSSFFSGSSGNETVGGGIAAYNADLSVADCTVTGNSATAGGGIFAASYNVTGSPLTITGSRIEANTAFEGGGVFNASGSLSISDSSISNNTAALPTGAGTTYLPYSGTLSGLGGGLLSKYMNSGSTGLNVTISRSSISNNSSDGAIGGLGIIAPSTSPYVTNTLTVNASTISGNSAGLFGGAMVVVQGMSANVVNSTIADNAATGLTKYDTSTTPATTTNVPGIVGGLVFAMAGSTTSGLTASTLSFANSTISGNHADYGGGLYLPYKYTTAEASPLFSAVNTVIGGNTATVDGADILGPSGPTGPTGPSGPPEPALSLAFDHSLLGTPAAGNVTTNDLGGNLFNTAPMLGPLGNHGGPTPTMLALTGSPLIDAGGTNVSGTPFDQRGTGFPRVVGSAIDIGATEFSAAAAPPTSVPVPSLGNGGKLTLGGLLALAGLLLTRRRRSRQQR